MAKPSGAGVRVLRSGTGAAHAGDRVEPATLLAERASIGPRTMGNPTRPPRSG